MPKFISPSDSRLGRWVGEIMLHVLYQHGGRKWVVLVNYWGDIVM